MSDEKKMVPFKGTLSSQQISKKVEEMIETPFGEVLKSIESEEKVCDQRINQLSADKKEKYKLEFQALIDERNQLLNLIKESKDDSERKKYYRRYVKICDKRNALFASASQDDKDDGQKLMTIHNEITKEKHKKQDWYIALTVLTAIGTFALGFFAGQAKKK